MEFSEAFRPEDIANKTDFFDFVVTPEDNDIVLHNNFPAWSRKSMGLFANNNNAGTEDANGAGVAKEANNNNILPNFAVDDSFWDTGGVTKAAFAAAAAAVNIKMESPTLEDINDICWPSNCSVATPEASDAPRDKDTDGSIYTLTVVNGQDAAAGGQAATPGGQTAAAAPVAPQTPGPEAPPLWYRPPDLTSILREGDEQLRQAMSAMDSQYQTSLDIDSIISILPSMDEPLHGDMTHGAMGHGLFAAAAPSEDLVEDSGFVESKEEQIGKAGGGGPAVLQQGQQGEMDEVRTGYSENNNDWGYSNHNANSAAESLLRSALQGGKSSYLSQYSGPAHAQPHLQDANKTLTELGPPGGGGGGGGAGGGAAADQSSLGLFMSSDGMLPMEGMLFDDNSGGMYSNGPGAAQCASACSSTTCMDDILLSPLDDYDKLKMIENEVAESAKRYGVPHHGGHYGTAAAPPPPPPPATSMPAPHSSTPTTPRPKKKAAKRSGDRPAKPKAAVSSTASSSAPSAASSNGGARRERSLHHCTICSKAFKDKYSVNVHIRTHTGEKPFACSVCGKSFRQKAHLAKHYHTHIVQKSEHLGPSKALSTKAR